MSDKPEFDFTHFAHKNAREAELNVKRMVRLNEQIGRPGQYETEDEFEAALEKYNTLITTIETVISRVLVSVPESWLVPGAPDDLDWRDPDSLGWVRVDKFELLRDAALEARSPEEVSKN